MALADDLRGSTLRSVLKSYLLVGLVVIAILIGLFTVRVSRDVDAQAEIITRLIGELLADAIVQPSLPDEMVRRMRPIRDAVEDVDFPFVITDDAGRPFLWNAQQTGVELPEQLDLEELLSVDLNAPDERTAQLLSLVHRFDAQHAPIELFVPTGERVLLRLHYGRSRLSRRILWMPILEGGLIVAFMGVAFVAFRSMKRSEQRSLWVGMAKETAHQMGTPLTSLSGWLAILDDPQSLASGSELSEADVVREIHSDVERLGKVSARFSQIGGAPVRKPGRADEVLLRVCSYFRRRLPHLGKQVEIREEIQELPAIPLVEGLLDWALENLIKNALDACDKDVSIVSVRCKMSEDQRFVEIQISDNGRGMSASAQRLVFDPGYTTKERGWGMGLVLVRRIVTEYHRGEIRVIRSVEGQGTTMQIVLPTA